MLSIVVNVKTVNIFLLAEHTRKICLAYAQCAMKSFPCMFSVR